MFCWLMMSRISLSFLSFALEQEGFKVYTATDGEQGLAIAKKIEPELLILDIMMPKMNGVELCKELRKLPSFDESLIAFLTAKSGDEAEIEALNAGGDDYISKPIKPKVFVTRVKALTRRIRGSKTKSQTITEFGTLKN